MFRVTGSVLCCWLVCVSGAQGAQPLPSPLTLDDAIALAERSLPAIELVQAQRDADAAALAEAESLSGVRLSAIGRLRVVDPSRVSPDRDNNDSSAQLQLRKRLYDFGYSDAREQAARLAGAGGEWRYLDARQQVRLDIMRRFFDVILADLQFAHDNEAMAGAYVDADRARDRHELKKLSDVDLLAIESAYQQALDVRTQSQAAQRATRSQLALAMGRPGDLASDLVRPEAPKIDADPPDYDALVTEILANNPKLKAMRADVEAARAALEAERSGHGPVISAEVDASVYNRETSSTHPLGAGLVFEMPLLTGGAKDAAVAAAGAKLRQRSAQLAAAELVMRQLVLDLRQQLDNLRIRRSGLMVRNDYRELYLDRSRALYELEVKTDLGDAMTEITAVTLEMARAEFDWIMTRAELDALAGHLLPEEQMP
ncbi:MAG: TolC family protein [Chromatiaceae bacterium]|nr:TolC family protein [Gammaproteobacteria bacterium]MCP5300968.1 TolC family protein [Chromatiaceae bacterium]MCP5421559.1 TolC family protein [Chromatiaceae bacterium]